MTLTEQEQAAARESIAMISGALGEFLGGPSCDIDQMVVQGVAPLPLVCSGLVGMAVALIVHHADVTNQDPQAMWSGYLLNAERRRSE